MTIGVLFVCTANICRSPMAEGVFRTLAQRAGLEAAFAIASAGTTGIHAGEAPTSLIHKRPLLRWRISSPM